MKKIEELNCFTLIQEGKNKQTNKTALVKMSKWGGGGGSYWGGKETLNSKMASHAGGEEQNVKGRCGTKYVRRGQSLVLCLFLLFRCIPPCSV